MSLYEETFAGRYAKNFHSHGVTNPHASGVLQNRPYSHENTNRKRTYQPWNPIDRSNPGRRPRSTSQQTRVQHQTPKMAQPKPNPKQKKNGKTPKNMDDPKGKKRSTPYQKPKPKQKLVPPSLTLIDRDGLDLEQNLSPLPDPSKTLSPISNYSVTTAENIELGESYLQQVDSERSEQSHLELEQSYSELKQSYSELDKSYSELEQSYSELEERYQALEFELERLKLENLKVKQDKAKADEVIELIGIRIGGIRLTMSESRARNKIREEHNRSWKELLSHYRELSTLAKPRGNYCRFTIERYEKREFEVINDGMNDRMTEYYKKKYLELKEKVAQFKNHFE